MSPPGEAGGRELPDEQHLYRALKTTQPPPRTWEQVRDAIVASIQDPAIPIGTLLPSIKQMTGFWHVSSGPVARALRDLSSSAGMLGLSRGKRAQLLSKSKPAIQGLLRPGRPLAVLDASVARVEDDSPYRKEALGQLQLDSDEKLVMVDRVREYAGGSSKDRLRRWDRAFMQMSRTTGELYYTDFRVVDHGLKTLQWKMFSLSRAELRFSIEVGLATEEEKERLRLPPKVPAAVMRIRQVASPVGGKPYEYLISVCSSNWVVMLQQVQELSDVAAPAQIDATTNSSASGVRQRKRAQRTKRGRKR